jgi:hypothetical protein
MMCMIDSLKTLYKLIFSVVSVKKAIESLLDNDLDMADLYLSQGNPNCRLLGSISFTFYAQLFMHVDPKSAKKTVKSSEILCFWDLPA